MDFFRKNIVSRLTSLNDSETRSAFQSVLKKVHETSHWTWVIWCQETVIMCTYTFYFIWWVFQMRFQC